MFPARLAVRLFAKMESLPLNRFGAGASLGMKTKYSDLPAERFRSPSSLTAITISPFSFVELSKDSDAIASGSSLLFSAFSEKGGSNVN